MVKIIVLFVAGFDDDEAYTIVIARKLALSYFDHPPLHQWIAHGFSPVLGEGHALRLPFWALIVATNVPLYGLTRRLFGGEAALWALFAFNASAYFLVLPDGFILPDAPLLPLTAAAVWAIVEATFPPPPAQEALPHVGETSPGRRQLALWLVAGLALGLAGLAKYSAAFVPLGLCSFFVGHPKLRLWLKRPEPYIAAALALVVFSPAVIWNIRNGWASFVFQSSRAISGGGLTVRALGGVAVSALEQIGSLTPWILVPVALGMARALRRDASSGERLLTWLAVPPLVFFALLPLFGGRVIPHWFNPGWLFAYPLAGLWLSGLQPRSLRTWALASAALGAAIVALYLPLVIYGPVRVTSALSAGKRDPTRGSYDWPAPLSQLAWLRDSKGPQKFVVVDHWRVGGKLGVVLGPKVPICAFADRPRGFAFACDPKKLVGGDALIAIAEGRAADELPKLRTFFADIEPAEVFNVGRFGAAERKILLVRAHDLLRPYPLPYGARKSASP